MNFLEGILRRAGSLASSVVLAASMTTACGDSSTVTVTCNSPGFTMSCACPGGRIGKQTCGGDQQFSPCDCPAPFDAGGQGGSGGSSNGFDAASGGDVSTIATGTPLSSGPSRLIDVFVAAGGITVVTADSITLVDRSGAMVRTVAAPREVTAVAFDGATLAVADKAILTTYKSDLTPLAMATLTETCVGVAIVSADRVMCAGQVTFPTKIYTYNAMTGAPGVATNINYQVAGATLRRVPGKDDLVTLQPSLSSFQLLRVDATSMVASMGYSPSGKTYRASPIFAFAGNPADHVITEDGIFANIYAPMCDKSFATASQCFVQDGILGTLRGTEKFIGLDGGDGMGKAYALVDTPPSSSFDTKRCVGGCSVQQIDVAMRIVLTRKSYSLDLGTAVAARHDATANALVVGYARPGSSSSTTAPYPGYRVELLSY